MVHRRWSNGRASSAAAREKNLAGRFACLLMILAVVWATFSTVRVVLSLNRPMRPPRDVAEAALVEFLPPTHAALMGHGTWTIGEVPWYLSTERVSAEELPDRMPRPPVADVLGHDECKDCDMPDIWQELLAKYRVSSNSTDEFTIYDVRLAHMQLRVFSRRAEDREFCLGAYCAWPATGDQWTLITIRPRCPASRPHGPQAALGYPADVTRVAARWGSDGDLQCEIVLPQAPLQQFLDAYRQSGWHIERPTWAGNIPYYICVKGDQHVHLRVMESPQELGQVMIVVIPVAAHDSSRPYGTSSPQESRT